MLLRLLLAAGLIASGSLVTDEVEDRAGDEVLDRGELERREDAQEDGEESAGGDDNDVEEHEVPAAAAAAAVAFSVSLAGRCFLPAAYLSRRRCLSG